MAEADAVDLVSKDPWALGGLSRALRTSLVCLTAVRGMGQALQHVPTANRTESLCMEAVSLDGMALQFVPQKVRTLNVCLAAATQSGFALKFVPEQLRSEALCLVAVGCAGAALNYVPASLRVPELCGLALEGNGFALQWVPEDLRASVLASILPGMTEGVDLPLLSAVLDLSDVALLKLLLIADRDLIVRYAATKVIQMNAELIKATLREIELDTLPASVAPAAKKARL